MTSTIERRFRKDHTQTILRSTWHQQSVALIRPKQPAGGSLFVMEESKAGARAVCDAIGCAQQQVCVCSFLLSDPDIIEALLKKAQSGVPVYLLVASETKLKSSAEDGSFEKKTMDEHIALLARLSGWVLIRTADHFHAKFVLVDPQSPAASGFLSTANLTGEALSRNVELLVRLSREDTRALFRLFVWAFWEHAQRELIEPGHLVSIVPAARFQLPPRQGALVATAGSRRDLLDAVLTIISGATQELLISSFSFGHPAITRAICERRRSGVQVTVLSRENRPMQEPHLRPLAAAGVVVLGVPWLHAKAICADGNRGLIMTANLAEDSLDKDGFEVGLVLDRHEDWQTANAQLLRSVLQTWAAGASWRYYHEIALGQLRGRIARHENPRQSEECTVTELRTISLDDVRLRCCTELDGHKVPEARPLPRGEYAHVVEYEYRVHLPILDPKAVLLTKEDLLPKPKKKSKGKEKDKKPASATTPVPEGNAATEESDAPDTSAAPEPAADEAQEPPRPLPPFELYREPSGRRVLVIARIEEAASAQPHLQPWHAAAVVIRR